MRRSEVNYDVSFDFPNDALSKFWWFFFSTEEVLRSNTAIWMSNDGFLMLYGTFNDSLVEEQKYAWYGTSSAAAGNPFLYPQIRSLR